MTSADDSLIGVTADHSHVLNFAGYPRRGNPILGKVREDGEGPALDALGLPYTTLSYANGSGYRDASADEPGVQPAVGRPDLTAVDNTHHDHLQRSEEHTSEPQSIMRISYAVYCLKH